MWITDWNKDRYGEGSTRRYRGKQKHWEVNRDRYGEGNVEVGRERDLKVEIGR